MMFEEKESVMAKVLAKGENDYDYILKLGLLTVNSLARPITDDASTLEELYFNQDYCSLEVKFVLTMYDGRV